MRARKVFTGLSIGSLALTGMIAAGTMTGSAQESSTPPAAQTTQEMSAEKDQSQQPAVVGTPLLQPSIDLARAQEIAIQNQTDAAVVEVGLDGEDGVLTYSIELTNGMEVDIDATSGEILKSEQGDANDDKDSNGDHEDENGSEDENGADEENESGSEQG